MATAFQRNAFQNNAFQIDAPANSGVTRYPASERKAEGWTASGGNLATPQRPSKSDPLNTRPRWIR